MIFFLSGYKSFKIKILTIFNRNYDMIVLQMKYVSLCRKLDISTQTMKINIIYMFLHIIKIIYIYFKSII